MPLSHLTLTVSHLPTSTSFFLSCLQPLGYKFIGRHDDYIGFGQNSDEPADFWITEQKPGSPAGAAHVAFPAPSKDAVNSFFICALKAGGKIHGEPKTRDSQSGYFSAAIMDMDGNSIEAVYRPSPTSGSSSSSSSVARSVVSKPALSVVSKPALALLENGSAVSKATSKASSIKSESIAPPRSEARSYASRAITSVERSAPSERTASVISSREVQQPPTPTYVVHTTHTTQKADDGKVAKTIVGTLIGAAAGAAIAYAFTKSDSDSKETTTSTPQFSPQDLRQLISPLQATSQALSQFPQQVLEHQGYPALEAPPAMSTFSRADSRPPLTRSVTSKNPRASTIYEGTEFMPQGGGSVYFDENGRRASEGSVYSQRDMPVRAIEYPPALDSQAYPADVSTLISSFRDKSRISDKGSVYSSSTIKPPKSHHSYHSIAKSQSGSVASSTRSARQIPLPEGSVASYASYRSGSKSGALYDAIDIESHVTPNDSISQIDFDSSSRRSSYSHRSHTSKRSSKFDEPVRPSDSVSQVSSHASKASQRTVKASGSVAGGASQAGSRMSSRRGSQVA